MLEELRRAVGNLTATIGDDPTEYPADLVPFVRDLIEAAEALDIQLDKVGE